MYAITRSIDLLTLNRFSELLKMCHLLTVRTPMAEVVKSAARLLKGLMMDSLGHEEPIEDWRGVAAVAGGICFL